MALTDLYFSMLFFSKHTQHNGFLIRQLDYSLTLFLSRLSVSSASWSKSKPEQTNVKSTISAVLSAS